MRIKPGQGAFSSIHLWVPSDLRSWLISGQTLRSSQLMGTCTAVFPSKLREAEQLAIQLPEQAREVVPGAGVL